MWVFKASPDEILQPLVSLISKSEKSLENLARGTWQHTMLSENIRALRIAAALMGESESDGAGFSPKELEEALRALAAMRMKSAKARAKFAPGTSQHSLLRNRLRAFRVTEAKIKEALKPFAGKRGGR